MSDFSDLQELWHQTAVKPAITAGELISRIKNHRRQWLLKALGSIGLLLGTFVFIIWVVLNARLHWLSTQIGVGLVLIAIFMAVILQSRLLPSLFDRTDPAENNRDWLRKMEAYQRRQYFMHTRFMSVYYILLSIGLLLYMFEVTRGKTSFLIGAYAITFGWIAFSWFYLRPKNFNKQKEKMDRMLADIHKLTEELEKPGM